MYHCYFEIKIKQQLKISMKKVLQSSLIVFSHQHSTGLVLVPTPTLEPAREFTLRTCFWFGTQKVSLHGNQKVTNSSLD